MKKNYIETLLENYNKDIKLDDEQKRVILNNSKLLMVIAGAGSGKTTTLAAKVKYLVDVLKVNPCDILVISLTNKAISELRKIIIEDLKIEANICTFHKLAYDILKENDNRYRILKSQQELLFNMVNKNKKTKKVIKYILKDKKIKNKSKSVKGYEEMLTRLIMDNINLIKTLNIDIENLEKNDNIYFDYLREIFIKYNEQLSYEYLLDFNDMINKASKCKIKAKFKYIIVDEYQDISQNRLVLLKKIVDITSANLILVGDDFQTIFSFAGSSLKNFMFFKDKEDFEILKITHTYRNSQELIDVAGNFVMKDRELINKNLVSTKNLEFPVKIYGYFNDFDKIFEKIILEIIKDYGINKSILILGRYKRDINKLHTDKFVVKSEKIIYRNYPMLKIDFLTIHASKGLGYDNVILINLEKGLWGFPSEISNDRFTEKILENKNNINEERRLLYVAITRTKNRFYIISHKTKESDFLKEIVKHKNVVIDYKLK